MARTILFARQPVFDPELNVYAYELLYRDPEGLGPAEDFDGVAATTEVLINAYSNILENGQVKYLPAFVNFNAEWLYDGQLPTLPQDSLVLDVVKNAVVSKQVLELLAGMATNGYRIAVDPNAAPELQAIATIIKVDISGCDREQLQQQVAAGRGRRLLATKVESFEQFQLCKTLGFELFQGYFFARPRFIQGRKLSRDEMVLLELIGEVNNPETTADTLEQIVLRDPEMVVTILRLANSAAFNRRKHVAKVAEAIVLIGLDELRKWILLISLARNGNKPAELLRLLLVRGRMCALLAPTTGIAPNIAFMTGLLSGLDALLDLPQEEIISQLPIKAEIKYALNGGANPLGQLLQNAIHYSSGAWQQLPAQADEAALARAYQDSLAWCQEVMTSL